MTLFTTRHFRVSITVTKGGAYGYQLESKTRFVCGFSQGLHSVRAVASTGNYSGGYGRKIVANLFVASSTRLAPFFELGNFEVTQFCADCVRIIESGKNIWANFSLKVACYVGIFVL